MNLTFIFIVCAFAVSLLAVGCSLVIFLFLLKKYKAINDLVKDTEKSVNYCKSLVETYNNIKQLIEEVKK